MASVGLVEEMHFNPALNCHRLTDGERRWRGKLFQAVRAATWKLCLLRCVLVCGTNNWTYHRDGPNGGLLDWGVDNCGTDVFEVGWTSAMDTVECSSHNLELNLLWHWQQVENIMQDRKYGHACSHQQQGRQQRSASSGADKWLVQILRQGWHRITSAYNWWCPRYLHFATSEMWCWSGGRGILRKTVSLSQYCVL